MCMIRNILLLTTLTMCGKSKQSLSAFKKVGIGVLVAGAAVTGFMFMRKRPTDNTYSFTEQDFQEVMNNIESAKVSDEAKKSLSGESTNIQSAEVSDEANAKSTERILLYKLSGGQSLEILYKPTYPGDCCSTDGWWKMKPDASLVREKIESGLKIESWKQMFESLKDQPDHAQLYFAVLSMLGYDCINMSIHHGRSVSESRITVSGKTYTSAGDSLMMDFYSQSM